MEQTKSVAQQGQTVATLPNGQVAADQSLLQAGYDIYHVPITSDRRLSAPLIIMVKKMLRRLLSSILMKQVAYNAANSRIVTHLVDQVRGGRQAVYIGDNRILTRNVFGHKMFLPSDDVSLTPHLILDGYWEMWVTKFLLGIIREGDTVLDVGANVGYYTLLAASQVGKAGKVYSFEPIPDLFDLLYRSVEINGFLDRCRLLPVAVTDTEGVATFQQLKYHYGSSGHYMDPETLRMFRDQSRAVEVKTASLDRIFEKEGGKVDVVKIDVEGSEPKVIRGMKGLLHRNPDIKLLLEWQPANLPAVDELLGMGFSIRILNEDSSLSPVSVEDLKPKVHAMLYATRGR